jgi:hypothetical protein
MAVTNPFGLRRPGANPKCSRRMVRAVVRTPTAPYRLRRPLSSYWAASAQRARERVGRLRNMRASLPEPLRGKDRSLPSDQGRPQSGQPFARAVAPSGHDKDRVLKPTRMRQI